MHIGKTFTLLKYVGKHNFIEWSFPSPYHSGNAYMAVTNSKLKEKLSLFLGGYDKLTIYGLKWNVIHFNWDLRFYIKLSKRPWNRPTFLEMVYFPFEGAYIFCSTNCLACQLLINTPEIHTWKQKKDEPFLVALYGSSYVEEQETVS